MVVIFHEATNPTPTTPASHPTVCVALRHAATTTQPATQNTIHVSRYICSNAGPAPAVAWASQRPESPNTLRLCAFA